MKNKPPSQLKTEWEKDYANCWNIDGQSYKRIKRFIHNHFIPKSELKREFFLLKIKSNQMGYDDYHQALSDLAEKFGL